MKKLFALLLALTMLFLTACNNNPDDSTLGTGTGTGSTSNTQNQAQPSELELKDTIVFNLNNGFVDLPSRVVFEMSVDYGKIYTLYYNKADGNAYAYCFDPLCKHEEGTCLANPSEFGWSFNYTLFINNRFYTQTPYGKIVSYAFDGTDMRIEYDAGYDPKMANQIGWTSNPVAFGPYIYINQRKDEKGNPNTLRFNTETGEMENLTEKTGNYIWPTFFYNGEIYGRNSNMLWAKSDINVNYCEEIEAIPVSEHYVGSRFFGLAVDEDWNDIGIEIYDMKTGESQILTNEMLGIEHGAGIVGVDENYIYFYEREQIYLGEELYKDKLMKKYKGNDGSLYRVNHDGTGLVCIYEEDDFEITGYEIVISGNQFLIEGRNVRVRDNTQEIWDNGLLVGTIGADGKISELKPVEVVG